MSTEFPGNSKTPQHHSPDPKKPKIESVVTHEVTTRKKPLGKRLKEALIGGDSKSVFHYVLTDVLLPQAKDMLNEAASQGFEKLIFGETRPGRRMGPRPGSPTNYTSYNRYAARGNNPIGRVGRDERVAPVSPQPRSHTVDDILFASRIEAETVLDRMYDLLREYDNVSLSDLYSLVGMSSNYVDGNWGWLDLTGSGIQRVRDGYILNLPKPGPLD